MNKKWQVICAFVAIFLLGAVAGSVVSVRVVRACEREMRRAASEQFGLKVMKMFVSKLELTPEQEKKISPIAKKAGEQLGQLRHNLSKDNSAIIDRMNGDISKFLTDEQRAKLKEMQERRLRDERKRKEERERKEELERKGSKRPPPRPDDPALRPHSPDLPPPPVAEPKPQP